MSCPVALQHEAHDDRPVSIEDVVRDGPVDPEGPLVLSKLLLINNKWEGAKPHGVGDAGELHEINRFEPGLEGGAREIEALELEGRGAEEIRNGGLVRIDGVYGVSCEADR